MPDKLFTVQIYQVEEPENLRVPYVSLEGAIATVAALPLDQRERPINQKDRRLETLSQEGDTTLLNLATCNYAGPGRMKSGEESRSFELGNDEFFAFETAMLYDAQRDYLFLETGQGGMAAGATAKYFAGFAGRGMAYDMIPVVDPDAAARARQCRQIQKVEMRVALGPAGAPDRQAGLGSIAAFGEGFGAGIVDIAVNVGPDRVGGLVLDRVRALFNRVEDNDGTIQRMRVRGRHNEDDPIELIDLLQHRERRECTLLVDPETRKIPIDARWAALRAIHADYCADVP